jgi:hypothetical protein
MELLIHKRVRSNQTLQCANKDCGSKRLFYYRANSHYNAWKCHECGHFVVEGDAGVFNQHETSLNQREMALGDMERAVEMAL